jgi:hypothetical protein
LDKATSWSARLPARDSSMSLLEGGGGGRRLALAGRRLGTRCVLVHELVGRGYAAGARGPMPALSDGVTPRALYLTGSSRLWMARKRLLLLRNGGQVGRRGRHS